MHVCWQGNDGSKALLEDQAASSSPDPGHVRPFTKIVGTILPLNGIWNYPAHKNEPHRILWPPSPSATAHTLRVECASHFLPITVSLTEFILGWDIKNLRFIRSWSQVPRVLAGFESQPYGFTSQSHGFKSQSMVNSFIARGPLSIPLLMSMSEAFSVPFYTLIKFC